MSLLNFTVILSDVFETIQFDLNGTSVSLINFFENQPVGTRLSSLTAQGLSGQNIQYSLKLVSAQNTPSFSSVPIDLPVHGIIEDEKTVQLVDMNNDGWLDWVDGRGKIIWVHKVVSWLRFHCLIRGHLKWLILMGMDTMMCSWGCL